MFYFFLGIVRPCFSDYASPIVLVNKKDGTKRICVDYRKLNEKIIKDKYPLPLIDDQVKKLYKARVFSTIDLKNGFFHVPVEKSSRRYTAFITESGTYEFLKTPFGLCNSPAIFQRFINCVFKPLIDEGTVLAYMDDLIIPGENDEKALEGLEKVLRLSSEYGLEINWKKCNFLTTKIEYLGIVIEAGTMKPSPRKIEAVRKMPNPKNIKELQRLLGLTGYFRKYIKGYAIIVRPLTKLLKKTENFEIGLDQIEAIEKLKTILSNEPVLAIFNFESETELHTDASKDGLAAILFQKKL